jgi:hypothetical protein
MSRNPNPQIQNKRIKSIVQFLNNGGGSFIEMLEYVNQKNIENKIPTVNARTVQYDLQNLTSGNFEHSKSNLSEEKRKNLFRYEYKEKKYTWSKKSKIPIFGDMQDKERESLMSAFLILKKHESIPAMKKIIELVKEKYNIE